MQPSDHRDNNVSPRSGLDPYLRLDKSDGLDSYLRFDESDELEFLT
jgi:hypothetical protein